MRPTIYTTAITARTSERTVRIASFVVGGCVAAATAYFGDPTALIGAPLGIICTWLACRARHRRVTWPVAFAGGTLGTDVLLVVTALFIAASREPSLALWRELAPQLLVPLWSGITMAAAGACVAAACQLGRPPRLAFSRAAREAAAFLTPVHQPAVSAR